MISEIEQMLREQARITAEDLGEPVEQMYQWKAADRIAELEAQTVADEQIEAGYAAMLNHVRSAGKGGASLQAFAAGVRAALQEGGE